MHENKSFKKAIRYKKIGFSIWLVAVIPVGFKVWWVAIICVVLAIGFQLQYKCPYCGEIFDSRMSEDELKHCPKCGKFLSKF